MKTRLKSRREIPAGLDPEGAHPVKQERSRVLRDKALAVARELVEQGRYASTTMAEIARAVGCSVGALYFRFRDKEALFASVVEVAMAQEVEALQAQVAAGRYQGLPLRETVDRCVQDYAAFVRRNETMIRALYQRAGEQPEYWSIVRVAAFRMVQFWIEAVAQAAGRAGDRGFIRQAGTAFWFVSSSLVYSVLVIDRPVRPMSAREQLFWLNEMVMHFIGLEVPESLRGAPLTQPVAVPLPGAMLRPAAKAARKAVAAADSAATVDATSEAATSGPPRGTPATPTTRSDGTRRRAAAAPPARRVAAA